MKNKNNDLLTLAHRYARSHGMLGCDVIIAAYSGGADSSLLLHLLSDIAKAEGISLCAAHVNHMIRGESADADMHFCEKECERLGIKLHVRSANVPAIAKERGMGLEECAREVRYAFFEELEREYSKNGKVVYTATAHNATDNAETMLFNLTRGASIDGMCAIPPIRDGHVIRPLLPFSKEEILSECERLGVKYVTDSTNEDTAYTRNRIRHNVLPQLRTINPSLESSVFRTSEMLRADAEYLDTLAEQEFASLTAPLTQEKLREMPRPVCSRVLCKLLKSAGAGYEHVHIDECLCHIARSEDFAISLLGKKRLVSKNGNLTVENDPREKAPLPTSWEIPLTIGKNVLPDGSVLFLSTDKEEADKIKTQNVYSLFIQETLTSDTISDVIVAKSRSEGDVMTVGGHTKKVKKLFCECKTPQNERYALPLVTINGKLAWIPTVRKADGEGAQPKLYIAYLKQNNDVFISEDLDNAT